MPYRPKIIGTGYGVDGVHSPVLLWLHKRSPDLTQTLWRSLRRAHAQQPELGGAAAHGLTTFSGAAAGKSLLAPRSVRSSEA